jgi:hypothetical protein
VSAQRDENGVPFLMKCGHAANGTWQSPDGPKPACVICAGIVPGAHEVDDRPSLDGRLAVCSYARDGQPHPMRPNGGPIYGTTPDGQNALAGPVVSTWDLPFFRHKPESAYDEFFCGCFGWD